MNEHAAQMVDTFLRLVGVGVIQAVIQTACLTTGALVVLAVARFTQRPCNCGKKH